MKNFTFIQEHYGEQIGAPFEKYVNDAKNAPEIIMQTCKSLLS